MVFKIITSIKDFSAIDLVASTQLSSTRNVPDDADEDHRNVETEAGVEKSPEEQALYNYVFGIKSSQSTMFSPTYCGSKKVLPDLTSMSTLMNNILLSVQNESKGIPPAQNIRW